MNRKETTQQKNGKDKLFSEKNKGILKLSKKRNTNYPEIPHSPIWLTQIKKSI